jgi:putative oxidoreductase
MSVVHITGRWSFTRTQFLYMAVRVAVGFLLMVKAFYFISNIHQLQTMVLESNAPTSTSLMVGYITWAHMIGGAFIMLGLLTRIAVFLQLPIIIGALVYNLAPNTFGTGGELVLSVLVLILLVFFLVKGSGKISMDDYLQRKQL